MRLMKPTLVGALMALAMLALMHDRIMSGEVTLTSGAAAFVALHAGAVLLLASLVFFVPPARRFIRAHRPDLRHIGGILAGMVLAAGLAHTVMHGVA